MSFANEPTLELRRSDAREALLAALAELDGRLPLRVPMLIGDEVRQGAEQFESTDPGTPSRVVATAALAGEPDVAAAIDAAEAGFRDWGARPAAERAQCLRAAAAGLRRRRHELAALAVRECAKPWPDADADVCEAIDFLEYYAGAAVELERGPELLQVRGERNSMHHAPRGVAAVIAPWNFPFAIPTGMTAAALAAGNSVVLKPAEQAPASAHAVVTTLREGGVPASALSMLPGFGDVGAALVRDPRVHLIAFTGSSAVGLGILRVAAETPEGQDHVKRVIAEMGGKNCVLVDSDADLDDAIPAIVASGFGYAGQKCSAASRVLAHEAIAESLLERLAGAVDALVVGQADRFETDVPPLIESEAQERLRRSGARAGREGRVVAGREDLPAEGWFAAPTVAADLPGDSPLLLDELFGPLVTVEAVPSIDAALAVVDSLPFALTGGLFSRSPRTIDEVVRRMPVGNLYVNRAITGAMVARQPFGGNRRSGTGTQAGGPDYLRQFTEPRVVAENTMRHGLVTEPETT
jgi:RHH-type transcriptional regulator, proline utilization regulon repressor / proline dehydrogenase / delta 1-pyrroline-5-carboxylate dehydrogenase